MNRYTRAEVAVVGVTKRLARENSEMESKSESGANAGSVGGAKRKSWNVCPKKSADFGLRMQSLPRRGYHGEREGGVSKNESRIGWSLNGNGEWENPMGSETDGRQDDSESGVRTGERGESDTRTGRTGMAATVKGGVAVGDKDENVGEAERGKQRGDTKEEMKIAPPKDRRAKQRTCKGNALKAVRRERAAFDRAPCTSKTHAPPSVQGRAEERENGTAEGDGGKDGTTYCDKAHKEALSVPFWSARIHEHDTYEKHRCGIKATSQESMPCAGFHISRRKEVIWRPSRHSSADGPGVSYGEIGRPGKESGRVI
ncbi:hypothetical protein FB451DRAFT_1187448 [Mycena latifolia]|nr:hypothetical protein FB451DRAFT_1187448 [Mycena latifolia]